MYGLTRIFFQMCTSNVHNFFVSSVFTAGWHLNRHRAFADHGQLKLADLVAFRQIGVKIIFARKHAARRDFGVNA